MSFSILRKKAVSILLSMVLVFSFIPNLAYAEEFEINSTSQQEQMSDSADFENDDSQNAEEDILENDRSDQSNTVSDGSCTTEEAAVSSAVSQDENVGQHNGKVVSPNDVLEYLYSDAQVVSAGDAQTIVIALQDSSATIKEASITLKCSDNGMQYSVASTKIVDNTAAFEIV